MREFAHLVECDDPALIRKAVVLEKLNGMSGRFAAAAEGTSLDFARVDDVEPALWLNGATYAHVPAKSAKADDAVKLGSSVTNFYMTDAISRASATMAKATKARAANA